MDKKQRPTKVHFDELVAERLSSEQSNSIEQVEIQVQSAPKFLMMLNRGNVSLTINLRVSAKKFLVLLGTLTSFVWGATKVIASNWSTIQSLLAK